MNDPIAKSTEAGIQNSSTPVFSVFIVESWPSARTTKITPETYSGTEITLDARKIRATAFFDYSS